MQDVVMREESLARIWRELIPETPTGGGGQGSPAVPGVGADAQVSRMI
jgi:hypothetical protein